MYDKVIDKAIIRCPECRQKLRLPLFQSKILAVRCSKCNTEFDFDCKKYRVKKAIVRWGTGLLIISFIAGNIILPLILVPKASIAIAEVKKKVEDNYKEKIKKIESDFSNEIVALKNTYPEEIARIDKDKLREKATKHYAKIWEERKNYNSRYAITPREKAQLEMLALAKDKTKNIEKIIRDIARKAAPKNSEISTYTTSLGIRLDINFDMSELTSGEEGTRTKHSTINSLKKETIRLISKVTNDVYQFCQDLDLEAITIGCKHFVDTKYEDGSSVKRNIVIYKVRLDRKSIKELKHNPFLDIYSVTKYFRIEEDDFPNLKIGFL